MSPSLLLLLLLVYSSQASQFLGTVMTYYPKNTNIDGSWTVVLRYKLNFHSCTQSDSWGCLRDEGCGMSDVVLRKVDEERSGEWCQREGIMTRQVSSNAPFQLWLNSGNWIDNIKNGIVSWRAVTLVELRNRSDTGKANTSPQTTILPAVRVPSNCQRDFNLLAFDPDGDEVKCRYGITSLSECNPCTPLSVLNLSSSCTLSFSPTSNSNEGPYAVQLVMEDFPRETITLTQTNGTQTMKTVNDAISKIPVQFVLRVDPAVPSCTEGLYLPRFLPPTPANRAQLYTPVGQTLEISISAQANTSTISELLFSGPHNINQITQSAGQYILSWTPTENEDGESYPICFIVQALINSTKYHSELRCVIVTVGPDPTTSTTPTTTTTQTTTTIPPTTTPLNTTAINTTTTQNTTTIPPTTTPLLITTTTTPITTTIQTTAAFPTTATPLNTTAINTTTTQNTTTPPSTTPTPTTTASPSPVNTTEDTTAFPTPVITSLNQFIVGLRVKLSSSSPLSEENIRSTIIQQLKDELRRRGLPEDITLRLVSSMQLGVATTVTPGG
ncbi:mucin-2 isoform X3 [Lates calcarifer]|uniref:Mucin-2 isoform X2 n=1 Tax=Lates calcarifer TaxID=8187 RepID=A0AAJ8BFA9_LATCA|nr:mucin-2 isoform X2 [Lates calcarifer]XP_050931463.1 mucin-2 isoform X3 [Lates calcarifer]